MKLLDIYVGGGVYFGIVREQDKNLFLLYFHIHELRKEEFIACIHYSIHTLI